MKNDLKTQYNNIVCAGIFILNKSIINYIPNKAVDLVNDIFPIALNNNDRMFSYNSSEYVKDMGSPNRIKEVEKAVRKGLLPKKIFATSKKQFLSIEMELLTKRRSSYRC